MPEGNPAPCRTLDLAPTVTITTNSGTVTIAADGTATWSGDQPSAIGGQPVWTPPRHPDAPAQGDSKPNLRVAKFGDGYTARRPAGLNHIEATRSISFSNIYTTEKDAIVQFLRARGGWQPFWWQQPGEPMRRWVCGRWAEEQQGWDRWRVTCQLELDFTPVAAT